MFSSQVNFSCQVFVIRVKIRPLSRSCDIHQMRNDEIYTKYEPCRSKRKLLSFHFKFAQIDRRTMVKLYALIFRLGGIKKRVYLSANTKLQLVFQQ